MIWELTPEFVKSEFSPYIPADEIPFNSILALFVKVEPIVANIPTASLLSIVIVPLFLPVAKVV